MQPNREGKNKGKEKGTSEVMMSFLSYKVVRGTCLRFPEQLKVIVAGDILQQRLPACSVAVAVILAAGVDRGSRQIFRISYASFGKEG